MTPSPTASSTTTTTPSSSLTSGGKSKEEIQAQIEKLKAATQLKLKLALAKKKVDEAKAKLTAQGTPLPSLSSNTTTTPNNNGNNGNSNAPSSGPKKIVFTSTGQLVDEHGNVVQLDRKNVASLKANKVREEDIKTSDLVGLAAIKAEEEEAKHAPSKHFDGRLRAKDMVERKKKRGFNFVQPGKHIRKAQMLRYHNISRSIKEEMRDERSEEEEEEKEKELELPLLSRKEPPSLEWWDKEYVVGDLYPASLSSSLSSPSATSTSATPSEGVNTVAITDIITHPVPVEPMTEGPAPAPLQLMLTAKERKKIKRMKRQAHQREQQDLIRFGVVPAPEPKLSLKNMFRVIENENIQNPTAFEAKVRGQMEARKNKHEKTNKERQLTDEQRKEKKRLKLQEDTSVETHVAVFRAGDLKNGKSRFKVDVSTQQYNLTGCAVLYRGCNCVVVEGGAKGIRKFTHLMLNRIKWEPAPVVDELYNEGEGEGEDEEEGGEKSNSNDMDVEESVTYGKQEENAGEKGEKAILVWKGVVAARTFHNFQMKQCPTDASARKVLADRNVAHYWEAAKNGIALQQ